MRLFSIALLAASFAVVPCSPAQSSSPDNLPAAPSATLQQSQPKPSNPAPQMPAPDEPRASEPSGGGEPKLEPLKPATQPPATASAPSRPAAASPAKPAPTEQVKVEGITPANDIPETTIRKWVDEVNVIFTVTDKHGHFIKDLQQKDFTVRDDNRPPKQIVNFSRETNLPLRVGLLIDASNSIRDRFKFEQESAVEFLNQTVRRNSDQAFVIGFDTTPEVTADFTDNSDKLGRGIRMLRPGGGTAMYDAVYYACRDKLLKAQQSGPVRRAIVLISDGNDNQSRVTREEAIDMAQRAEVIIYAISTNTNGVKERGDKVLERMSEATGGRAFFPFKVQDVANAFAEIQDELRSQYAIAYKPAEFATDGRYHAIEILAENHKNLKVRARKGYYAPKQ